MARLHRAVWYDACFFVSQDQVGDLGRGRGGNGVPGSAQAQLMQEVLMQAHTSQSQQFGTGGSNGHYANQSWSGSNPASTPPPGSQVRIDMPTGLQLAHLTLSCSGAQHRGGYIATAMS